MLLLSIVCTKNIIYLELNPQPLAAVTSRSDVTVLGNITIDGRDWDPDDPSSSPGDGVPGINFTNAITQSGNAKIGGMGSPPIKNAGIPIVNPINNSPSTPEEALGLEPGALDGLRSNLMSELPFYDTLIYYIGGDLQAVDLEGSSGILIIHNDTWTAKIKNLKGDFNGIIICDQLDHVTAGSMVYGAIYTLSDTPGGNALGLGNADIRYSSSVIDYITLNVKVEVASSYNVVSWKQK